jgi:WD40 repeat protein/tRNA A-37 threonylcarbamoyl transferase component Bud32
MSTDDPIAGPPGGTEAVSGAAVSRDGSATSLVPGGAEDVATETVTRLKTPTDPEPPAATVTPDVAALLAELGFDAEPDSGTTCPAPPRTGPPPEPAGRSGFPTVPGYQIVGELGRGGMGVVYRARHLRLNRTVAIKMVLRSRASNPIATGRFLIEAEAMASVRHPHVVQVFEFGECDGNPFLVLEHLSGGSLSERLTGGRIAPMVAARLIAQLARAAAAIHAAGVVHRDLKPGNVLFDADGLPKISDFGLAKRAASDLTETQAVMGTPAYMAPEQADGRTKFVGPPADVWSLGVILYECLVGVRPFAAPAASEVLARILTSDPLPVRRVARELAPELELICQKCLEKEPARRYGTADELADDLERFLIGRPISVRPLGRAARAARWVRRNPVVAALGAFAAATLLVVPPAALLYRSRLKAAEELTEARAQAEAEARRAEAEARTAATVKEYHNLLGRARHAATDPQPGWTWDGLRDLTQAGGYAERAGGSVVELRSAAAACLAAPDVREAAVAARGVHVRALAFRPDGKVLAVAEGKAWIGCRVFLVDPTTGTTLRTLTFSGPPVQGSGGGFAQDGARVVTFSPDGRWLVVGCRSGQICRWDLSLEKPVAVVWAGHRKETTGVAFDPDGACFYTSATDGTVKRWATTGTGQEPAAAAPPDPTGTPSAGGLIALPGEPRRVVFERNGLESAAPETLAPVSTERVPGAGGWRAATPTGSLFLTDGPTGLAVWDRALRRCGRNLADPELGDSAQRGYGRGAAVTPCGALAATFAGSTDGTLRLWDLTRGRLALRVVLGETLAAAFSPDGHRLAVAADRRTVIYEVRRGPEFHALAQASPVRAFAVRPDGRVVTVAAAPHPEADGSVGTVALEWPAVGSAPRTLWTRTTQPVSPTFGAAPFAGGVAFSDGNGWVDFECGGAIKPPGIRVGLPGGDEYAFRSDRSGQRLWMTRQNRLTVFDAASRTPLAEWRNDFADFASGLGGLVCVDAGERYAAVGGRDGTVRLVHYEPEGATGRILIDATWTGSAGAATAVALSGDESLVAAGSHLGRVVVRRVPGGAVVADLSAHTDRVTSVAFSGDGRLLATASRDKRVRLWRRTGDGFELLVNLAPVGSSGVRQVAFGPGGRLLVLREGESGVQAWDVERLRTRLTEMGIGW